MRPLFLRLSKVVEQGLGLFQVGGVEALGEPIVYGREEIAGLFDTALLMPKARKRGGDLEFKPLSRLVAGDFESCKIFSLGGCRVPGIFREHQCGPDTVPIGARPALIDLAPHVKGKIIKEFTHRGGKNKRVRTPSVVKKQWVNFADRKDPVALDVHLRDDYKENSDAVQCEDDLVDNDYRIKKRGKTEFDRNHHKSYGYLRTPEFSALVKSFLSTA